MARKGKKEKVEDVIVEEAEDKSKKVKEEEFYADSNYEQSSNLNRRHVGMKPRILFWLILITFFTALGVLTFLKGFSNISVNQFFYSETSNLDYKVCLKENTFFNETCLDKDRKYIANIIDYIDTEFKYTFNASQMFNYKYKYSIVGKVIATEKGDSGKIIYNKEEILLEEKSINMNDMNTFTIKENLKINYGKYNETIKALKNEYTLALDSNLIVTLHIELDGNYSGIAEKIATKQNISLTIPLSEQTLEVMMDYKDINNNEVIESESRFGLTNVLLYLVSGFCLIFDLLIIVYLLRFFRKAYSTKSVYEKTLDKILKEYNQIIVNTKKIPDFNNVNIIEVNSFDELLDARELIGKPILYIKINNQKTWFVISSGEGVYRYVMKAADLDE